MFGLKIIASTEYEELVSARETLGDRVRHLESKLSNADNALKAVEGNLQNICVVIAADNFLLEVQKLSPVEVKHE